MQCPLNGLMISVKMVVIRWGMNNDDDNDHDDNDLRRMLSGGESCMVENRGSRGEASGDWTSPGKECRSLTLK